MGDIDFLPIVYFAAYVRMYQVMLEIRKVCIKGH